MPITQQAWQNPGSAPLRKTRTYTHIRHCNTFSLSPCLLLSCHLNSYSLYLSLSRRAVYEEEEGGWGRSALSNSFPIVMTTSHPTISRAILLLPRWPDPVPSPLLSMNWIGLIKESDPRAVSPFPENSLWMGQQITRRDADWRKGRPSMLGMLWE